MTLQNGLAMKDRALLWSDTAFTDPATGTLIATQSKVFTTTCGIHAAVSMATIGGLPDLILQFLVQRTLVYFRLGDLLEDCELALRRYCQHQPDVAVARLLVAAWCDETDEARLFAIASDGGNWDKPFQAVEVEHFVSSANRSAAYQLAIANGVRPDHLPAIIEAQRHESIVTGKGGFAPYHGIGGSLVEFEVTQAGVTHRVVREWPDRVGERIEPTRVAA